MSRPAPNSSRTSFEGQTTTEKNPGVRNHEGSPEMNIAKVASAGEQYYDGYGGDDVHEPPPKEFLAGETRLVESEATFDANMVTWDGPNDPSNPQNWSKKYKWMVTIVCTIMTLNVYV